MKLAGGDVRFAPRVGDKLKTWFSDRPDGMSTVLGVRRYTGRYPEHFSHVVSVTAPRTRHGALEMAIGHDSELEREDGRRTTALSGDSRVQSTEVEATDTMGRTA